MCSSCEEDQFPTREFKAVSVSLDPDHKAIVVPGRTLNLCLPCYRIALHSYQAATFPQRTAREVGARPKLPQTIKAV